jgi:hypothetical protein
VEAGEEVSEEDSDFEEFSDEDEFESVPNPFNAMAFLAASLKALGT